VKPGVVLGRALRYGRAALRAGRANVARLPAPLKLTFAVTYWCQYRCATCNIWQRKPEDELTTDEILAFVARNRDFAWVDVTGGEIFLRPDITEVLEAMAASWPRLAVLHYPTNGFLTDRIVSATRAIVRRRGPAVIVTVSVDGDEALNDEIRGIRGGFKQQMATVRGLQSLPGVRVAIGMTLSERNADAVERTFAACAAACPGLSRTDLHVNAMQLSSHFYGNVDRAALMPAQDKVLAAVREARQVRGVPFTPSAWLETQYLKRLESFLRSGRTPMPCHALRSSAFVDPWGIVFPCLTYTRPLGSLREAAMSLAPIWDSAGVRSVQQEIWRGDCPQCWTACDAYPSILGNALRPGRAAASRN